MRHLKQRRTGMLAVYAAVFAAQLVMVQCSLAQWTPLKTFSAPVRVVCFPPVDPSGRLGFVGLDNGDIWRTTDEGITWSKSLKSENLGEVTSFTFKNANVGWCSAGLVRSSAAVGVFKTTDGGLTWQQQPITGPRPRVYYDRASSRLFVASWTNIDKPAYSTNEGTSWTPFSTYAINTIGFSSSGVGLALPFNNAGPALRTANAGVTWSASPLAGECWEIFTPQTSRSVFTIAETKQLLYRSDDDGLTWGVAHDFARDVQVMGTIVGELPFLFAQSTSSIIRSTDEGRTWTNIGGPGRTVLDVRIEQNCGTVYAAGEDLTLYVNRSASSVIPFSIAARVTSPQIQAGELDTIAIVANSDLPSFYPIDEVSASLTYNTSLASYVREEAGTGWNIASSTPTANGHDLVISRSTLSGINNGDVLARIIVQTTIGDDLSTPIHVANVAVKGAGTTPSSCVLLFTVGEDQSLTTVDGCGTAIIRRFMQKQSIVDLLLVNLTGRNRLTLSLKSAEPREIELSVTNVLGEVVSRTHHTLSAGLNTLTIDAPSAAGTYIVSVDNLAHKLIQVVH